MCAPLVASAKHVPLDQSPCSRSPWGGAVGCRVVTTSPLESTPLVVRTVPLDDPGPLLDLLPDTDVAAWVRRRNESNSILVTDGNYTYVAIDDHGHPQPIRQEPPAVSA